jgi:hypothetical protein
VSLLERVLCKLLPYRDITKVVDGVETLYLRRFFLRRGKKGSTTGDEGGIFLHVIHRNDDDRDPHDHPWDFTSVILKGGYVDEQWRWDEGDYDEEGCEARIHDGCGGSCNGDGSTGSPGYRTFTDTEPVGVGSIVRRYADHLHRVQGIVPGRPAWTLVFTGARRHDWGFVTETGWQHWRKYLGLPETQKICFCPSRTCEHSDDHDVLDYLDPDVQG